MSALGGRHRHILYDTHAVMDKIKAGAPGLLELIGYNTKLTKTTPTLLKIHIFVILVLLKR